MSFNLWDFGKSVTVCPFAILTQTGLVDKVPGHGQYVLALSLPRRNRHFELLRVPVLNICNKNGGPC